MASASASAPLDGRHAGPTDGVRPTGTGAGTFWKNHVAIKLPCSDTTVDLLPAQVVMVAQVGEWVVRTKCATPITTQSLMPICNIHLLHFGS